MEVKEVIYKYSRPSEFRLHPIGDIHWGIQHCAEKLLRAKVKEIAEDRDAIWIGMGDYCECITPGDKRWDIDIINKEHVHPDNIASDQLKGVSDILAPIKDKCVGLLEGNHEDTIRRYNHDDMQKNLCDKLGVTNLGYSAYVRFIFRRGVQARTYLGYFAHGAGCAITPGTKLNRLYRMMIQFDADIYAIGHMHDIITHQFPYLTLAQNNQIKQREKVGAVTGSWFKTYEQGVRASYGERKGYPPTTLGSPTFVIIPDKDVLRVEK